MPGLSILVIHQNGVRASIIEEGLRDAGYSDVTVVAETRGLVRRIQELAPDVVVIDLENPDREALEHMFEVTRAVRRPIAMFVDRSDAAMIEAAIEAGVSAYVVDGLRKERVRPILEMAVSRFAAFDRLRDELERTRQALGERRTIERAKGILMKRRGMSEEEAYTMLRQSAMNQGRRIGEVASSILVAAELLGEEPV
ncbi:MAG TPA: ANTAR domain-containing protein [Candidatus Binatia bacterium]|nr:ANTAR domain-containing protein [Candidatus Binatia bacterium]